MAVTHAQQVAKLQAEIERLRGEVAGLRYAVAARPYQPIQYIPAPRVYPIPTYPAPYITYSQAAKTTPYPQNTMQSQVSAA